MKLGQQQPKTSRWADGIDKLPLMTVAGLTGFSLVAILLLLLNIFYGWLIWPVGLSVAIAFGLIVLKFGKVDRPGISQAKLACDLLVLVGVVAWGSYNVFFTSQHILTNRDPATYANTAAWLSDRNDLRMPTPTTLDNVASVTSYSAGFALAAHDDKTIYAQGQHLLPALLGALGKIIGPRYILHLNVLFGITALLAIYCFARLFIKPYWAMMAAGIIAVSMPMLYFSRDTYTEPLAATFTFGGLALLWIAQKNRHVLLWLLAGFALASGVLTRIDAYLTLVGIAAFLAVYLALANGKEYRTRLMQVAVFSAAASFVCVLGWLDLILLSKQYYQKTQQQWLLELLALAVVIVMGVSILVASRQYPRILTLLHKKTASWRSMVASLVVVGAGIILASRPLWWGFFTAGAQQVAGSPATHRTYAELTTNWVSWYVGPVVAVLGLAGLAVAVYRSMRDKSLLLLCGLFVILGTACVYLVKPSITPDQIWASRRMVPAIMPGVVIFGMYASMLFFDAIKIPSVKLKSIAIVLAGIGLLVPPLVTSRPLIKVQDTAEYAFISGVCTALPAHATVVWIGMGRLEALQPTRSFCHAEAYGYSPTKKDTSMSAELAEIAKAVRAKGRTPVLGVYSNQAGLIDTNDRGELVRVSDLSYTKLLPTYTTPPQEMVSVRIGASLATIQDNGSLAPLRRN